MCNTITASLFSLPHSLLLSLSHTSEMQALLNQNHEDPASHVKLTYEWL